MEPTNCQVCHEREGRALDCRHRICAECLEDKPCIIEGCDGRVNYLNGVDYAPLLELLCHLEELNRQNDVTTLVHSTQERLRYLTDGPLTRSSVIEIESLAKLLKQYFTLVEDIANNPAAGCRESMVDLGIKEQYLAYYVLNRWIKSMIKQVERSEEGSLKLRCVELPKIRKSIDKRDINTVYVDRKLTKYGHVSAVTNTDLFTVSDKEIPMLRIEYVTPKVKVAAVFCKDVSVKIVRKINEGFDYVKIDKLLENVVRIRGNEYCGLLVKVKPLPVLVDISYGHSFNSYINVTRTERCISVIGINKIDPYRYEHVSFKTKGFDTVNKYYCVRVIAEIPIME